MHTTYPAWFRSVHISKTYMNSNVAALPSCVWLFVTPWTVVSSVHGVLPARIAESVAISFSRGSSWPRDWTCASCIGRRVLYHWATWEAVTIPSGWPYLTSTGIHVIGISLLTLQVNKQGWESSDELGVNNTNNCACSDYYTSYIPNCGIKITVKALESIIKKSY